MVELTVIHDTFVIERTYPAVIGQVFATARRPGQEAPVACRKLIPTPRRASRWTSERAAPSAIATA